MKQRPRAASSRPQNRSHSRRQKSEIERRVGCVIVQSLIMAGCAGAGFIGLEN